MDQFIGLVSKDQLNAQAFFGKHASKDGKDGKEGKDDIFPLVALTQFELELN